MTGAQSDYLADLALKKGVRLDNIGNKSVAWASAKIEELKALPDATFAEITEEEEATIDKMISQARKELKKWTFTT